MSVYLNPCACCSNHLYFVNEGITFRYDHITSSYESQIGYLILLEQHVHEQMCSFLSSVRL